MFSKRGVLAKCGEVEWLGIVLPTGLLLICESKIFFTTKFKIIHIIIMLYMPSSWCVVICKLLPAWANHVKTSIFSCCA